MRRISRLLPLGLVLALAGVAFFAKWERAYGHDVPGPVSVLLGAGVVVYCGLGLVRFVRASAAKDRPPLAFSNGWLLFLVSAVCLLGIPVIDIATDDPERNAAAEALMFSAGIVLVGLFIWYIRKPVLDHGVPVGDFSGDDRRRRRSPQVSYGRDWTVASDPSGVYAVLWLRDTREICAVRSRRLPGRLRVDLADPFANTLLDGTETVEVLGWAEDEATLDRALAGWQQHIAGADSLSWLRARLAQAAAATSPPPGVPRP